MYIIMLVCMTHLLLVKMVEPIVNELKDSVDDEFDKRKEIFDKW